MKNKVSLELTCYSYLFQISKTSYKIPVLTFDCTLRVKNFVRKLTGTCTCEKEKFAAIWAPSCGMIRI